MFKLSDATLYIDKPVVIDAELRGTLEDIIENAQAIQRYIAGMDLAVFEEDQTLGHRAD